MVITGTQGTSLLISTMVNRFNIFVGAVLSEARALFSEAQAMAPQANVPFAQLDTLGPSLLAVGGSTAGLVGVQAFSSSSVMDDMALAAVWLAAATGKALT
jgi:hypothetical protein